MTTLVIITTLVPLAAGFILGRWAVTLAAPGAWVLFILGEKQGWWGHGVGDGWEYALIVGAAAAAAGAAVGVAVRRRVARRPVELLDTR